MKFAGSSYEGEFKKGLYEGDGRLLYEDGDMYHGSFRLGFRHGNGVLRFADMCSYEGEFDSHKLSI
jgi:hypothetical protein